MSKFEKLYKQILNEQSCPVTFTPEPLLDYIREKCYLSNGQKIFFTIKQLLEYCDDINKPLFSLLVKNLKSNNDYAILIIYFNKIEDIDEIINTHGYFNIHQNYPTFSMKKVWEQFKRYFKVTNKSGANFNSIDVCPQLGCVIGLNGINIKTYRDFEKNLDHQLNHYFQKMNIKFDKAQYIDNVIDNKTKIIEDKLKLFYGLEFSKDSFIDDLKYHLFNFDQFRSMCADVFHQLIRYNENHIKEIEFQKFINDIKQCNYKDYPIKLQECILFSWICLQINKERWNALIIGLRSAFEVKRNIFQKFYIKGRDIFRNIYLKNKSMN